MSHTPYGYRIENGQAVIDEAAACKIRQLYKSYLSGKSLMASATEASLSLKHTGAKHMMQNPHYLGDDFYPAIIDKETFDAVTAELAKRSTQLGRNNRIKPQIEKPAPTHFIMRAETEVFSSALQQAEYRYSLIEEVV